MLLFVFILDYACCYVYLICTLFVIYACFSLQASRQKATDSPSPLHPTIKASLSHDKPRERVHPITQMTHTRSQSFTIGKLYTCDLTNMTKADFCLACDEVAKARHRCYFQAAALVFLKALYL